MTDREFDELLKHDLEALAPSPQFLDTITPWRQAMDRVFVGLALTAVSLNFLLLDYILPLIGFFLIFLGFRSLRRENLGFKVCWVIAAVRLALWLVILIINATVWQADFYALTFMQRFLYCNLALNLIFVLFMLVGFRSVQRKAGLPIRTGALIALLVWYLVLYSMASVQYVGWVLAILLILACVLIIRSLFRLSAELQEAGYVIQAAPVKVSDRHLVYTLLGLLSCGIVMGYGFFDEYPMEWEQTEPAAATQEELKAHLLSIHFPETLLSDLTEEEIAACQGAEYVFVNQETYETMYDGFDFRTIEAAVLLPGEKDHWMIFHHFEWLVDPGFRGTEALQIWPSYRNIEEGWSGGGILSGRVLYDEAGETYASPFFRLATETYQTDFLLFGPQTNTDLFASFSFPNGKERYRGYLCYDILEKQEGYGISSGVNYIHQISRIQYPVKSAADFEKTVGYSNHLFQTTQTKLNFWPKEEMTRPLS